MKRYPRAVWADLIVPTFLIYLLDKVAFASVVVCGAYLLAGIAAKVIHGEDNVATMWFCGIMFAVSACYLGMRYIAYRRRKERFKRYVDDSRFCSSCEETCDGR